MADEVLPPAVPDVGTPALQDKRLWLTVATLMVMALNKKLGLGLEATELTFLSTLAMGYVAQSQLGQVFKARAAGKLAADAIKTPSDALGVMGGPLKALVLVLAGALALGVPSKALAQETAPAKMEVKEGMVLLPDSTQLKVGPGCYLNEPACVATGKEIADLRAQVKTYEGSPTTWAVTAGLVVLALGAGFAAAWALKK